MVLVISYSRKDQTIIRPVVALLRAAYPTIKKTVFWDDDLEPGESWFEQIKESIDSAPKLFVFWCEHSSMSKEVRREFLYAFRKRKRVIPVLLDDTPLDKKLGTVAGIDLRKAVAHRYGELGLVTTQVEQDNIAHIWRVDDLPEPHERYVELQVPRLFFQDRVIAAFESHLSPD